MRSIERDPKSFRGPLTQTGPEDRKTITELLGTRRTALAHQNLGSKQVPAPNLTCSIPVESTYSNVTTTTGGIIRATIVY